MKLVKGSTRWVFILKRVVIKIPSLYSYKNFINGILSNIQEHEFSKVEDFKYKLCPVWFYLPLGLLLIMPKAKVNVSLPQKQLENFCQVGEFKIPAELKNNSFGYLNGNLVAVDYG